MAAIACEEDGVEAVLEELVEAAVLPATPQPRARAMAVVEAPAPAALPEAPHEGGRRQSVRIYCRVRPGGGEAQPALTTTATELYVPRVCRTGARGALAGAECFSFNRVFGASADTAEVFEATCGDALSAVVRGENAAVLCYGQTGSGKTHTMRGLTPRSLSRLFATLPPGCAVRVSYVELLSEQWRDLLCPATPSSAISVQEVEGGGVTLRGAEHRSVASEAEALAASAEGEARRSTAAHALNDASSRSHAIFTVHVRMASEEGGGAGFASKLHLVDLAGSERLGKSRSEGGMLRQSRFINTGLSFLEQAVLALSSGAAHVPYRSSRLTHALKDALAGGCRTSLLACVWGGAAQARETAGTCRFAQRIARVALQPRRNDGPMPPEMLIAQLRRSVAALRAQVAAVRRGSIADAAPQEGVELEAALRRFFRPGAAEAEAAALVPPGAGVAAARAALVVARRLYLEAAGLHDPPHPLEAEAEVRGGHCEPPPPPSQPPSPPPPPQPQRDAASDDASFEAFKLGPGAEAAALLAENAEAARRNAQAQAEVEARGAGAAAAAATAAQDAGGRAAREAEAAEARDELASLQSDGAFIAELVRTGERELQEAFLSWQAARRR